jgi:hypothetical protein
MLKIKKNPIGEDYKLNDEVLGVGISGNVITCINRHNQIKYALKVNDFFEIALLSSLLSRQSAISVHYGRIRKGELISGRVFIEKSFG